MKPLEFGEYLKQLRKAKKMSTRSLEQLSGVSNSFISQIEQGGRVPSSAVIRKLSKALDVTHIGMMIKAGHVTEEEVLTFRKEQGASNERR